MAQFADYGFNKSHSVAYAHVAYQTAYLKAHYPEHFYAAVMTYQADDAAKIFKYASELRAQGIKMLPPDVNESGPGFTPVAGAIRFGLAAIKGIGQTAVAHMIEARKERHFTSLFDFAERVSEKGTGKRVLESLVCAGAFDSLKPAGEVFTSGARRCTRPWTRRSPAARAAGASATAGRSICSASPPWAATARRLKATARSNTPRRGRTRSCSRARRRPSASTSRATRSKTTPCGSRT